MSHEFGDFQSFRARVGEATAANMGQLMARLRLGPAELAELQTRRLRELLAYARERSPFYARRLAGIDPARFELADLPRIPVVTKSELMAELDSVFTDRRLTRELAERALAATCREVVPVFGEYLVQATGGSSGQRGIFASDIAAWTEVIGSLQRCLFVPGVSLIAVVAAASPVHSTGLSVALNEPGKSPVRIVGVPVTLPLPEIVARLTELQPHRLGGYPSVLVRLAHERSEGRLPIAPKAVVMTSEMCSDEVREAIRLGFGGVPLIDAFGTTEGLMGATRPDERAIEFNSDTCIVELVDRDDRPVPRGEPSDHVLITNLANRVQPLIRYRIDDCFTQQPDSLEHGRLRALVSGRQTESLRWPGVEIHPLVIGASLLKHAAIVDYQVRQTPRGVDVRVIGTGAIETSELEDQIRAGLTGAGLANPQVGVTRVESLERNRDTGKLRRFVPL